MTIESESLPVVRTVDQAPGPPQGPCTVYR